MARVSLYIVKDERSRTVKKGYSLRIRRRTTIGEQELARYVEADSHINHARVEYIMASVVKQLKEMLLNGHKVELGELGLFGLTCHATGSDSEAEVSVRGNVKGLQVTYRPTVELRQEMQHIGGVLVPYGAGQLTKALQPEDVYVIKDREEE